MIRKILTITASVEVAVDENDVVNNIESAKELSEQTAEALEYLEDLGWKLKLEHLETEKEMNERVQYEKSQKNKNFTAKDVRVVKLDAGVRYWEDTDVNGEEDDCDDPKIPGVTEVDGEKHWVIEIDTKTGKIKNWPKGVTADVHYKTCDENVITFYNEYGDMLGEEYECYVPDFLCINDSGYGDYIIMEIDGEGKIMDFELTDEDIESLKENAF